MEEAPDEQISVRIRSNLNRIHDGLSRDVDDFLRFPIVFDRLRQIKTAYSHSPKQGVALEFGVFTGGSLRALALANKGGRFTGFDSFKGPPEAWRRSETITYAPGHFALDALPLMPPNVSLVAGFFDGTLPSWLAANSDPVSFIHIDVDLYSAAKFVLSSLTDRIVDGAVIVFDELGDWKDEGVYPLWREGEWLALREWLAGSGFVFRILSRGQRFEAAIQVFRTRPKPRSHADDLNHATQMWEQGAREYAVQLLQEAVQSKPGWLSGAYRLALWQTKLRRANDALETIAAIWQTAQKTPDHSHAINLYRLRAECQLRLADLDKASDDISFFREQRPAHVSGLALFAVVASRRRDHESAAEAWSQAFHLSGLPSYRVNATTEHILSEIRSEFREMKFSGLMVQHLIDSRLFETVLDIGSGTGEQANALRRRGKIVTELDFGESQYFKNRPEFGGAMIGDFLKIEFSETYDCVLASHVLEHQLNVNAFLRKINAVVREGGVVAISVPPLKHQIVGGHVTLWNAGLLLYNLVLAGFDCRTPWVRQYGYNISVVIEKREIAPQGLVYDSGDIDRIRDYLPEGCGEGFYGEIHRLG